MTEYAVKLLEAALALPDAERAELAERLAESVRPESGRLHPAWEGELRRRTDELDLGAVRGIPLAEAIEAVCRGLERERNRWAGIDSETVHGTIAEVRR